MSEVRGAKCEVRGAKCEVRVPAEASGECHSTRVFMVMHFTRGSPYWKKGIELAMAARAIAKGFPRDERFRLEDQLCRAARSVPANIAEGFGRYTRPEFRKYLGYVLGEAAEVDTPLEIAFRSGLCAEEEARLLQGAHAELGWMIRRFKSSIPGRG